MENSSFTTDRYWLLPIVMGFILLTIKLNLRNSSYFQKLSDYLSRKTDVKDSLINLSILIIPSIIYLIAPSTWYFIDKNGDALKTITGIGAILGVFLAFLTFQRNLEFEYFKNIQERYKNLHELLSEDLKPSSLAQLVITIKSIRKLNILMKRKFVKDLIDLEEESTRAFIKEKFASVPLKYFTGYEIPETEDIPVDRSSQGILIDLRDPRELHERLLNAMKENDESSDNKGQRFVFLPEFGKWQFQSGLSLEHIFVLLAFINGSTMNLYNEKMRTQTINRLKSIRITYPKLSACLYYLWDKHGEGKTFRLQIEEEF